MKLKKEVGTDCPTVLKSLLVGPTDEAQKAAEGTVYQVRVEGENAFILFTPLGGTASYFVMKHDPDGWKSTSLSSRDPVQPGGGLRIAGSFPVGRNCGLTIVTPSGVMSALRVRLIFRRT